MIKNYFFLFQMIFIGFIANAQNLIPNPSFESDDTSTINCGIYLQADFNASVKHWVTPTGGTPDLFAIDINQSCWNFQPNSTYPGPICLKGPQLPRTGRVMAGIFCYTIPGLNQREYVQSPLISPLIPGNNYYVEFYISLADNTELNISNVGAYFSDLPVTSSTDQPLPFTPQVISPTFITDTSLWTKISGTFQATAAANYITIGNFSDDASTTTGLNPGGGSGPGCYGAYYFIDDVSVMDLTTGIDDPINTSSISVFPNPVYDKIIITTRNIENPEFIIYDITFKELIRLNFKNTISVDVRDFSKGTYFYEVRNNISILKKGKFVKN